MSNRSSFSPRLLKLGAPLPLMYHRATRVSAISVPTNSTLEVEFGSLNATAPYVTNVTDLVANVTSSVNSTNNSLLNATSASHNGTLNGTLPALTRTSTLLFANYDAASDPHWHLANAMASATVSNATLGFIGDESFFDNGTDNTLNGTSNGTVSNSTISFMDPESFFGNGTSSVNATANGTVSNSTISFIDQSLPALTRTSTPLFANYNAVSDPHFHLANTTANASVSNTTLDFIDPESFFGDGTNSTTNATANASVSNTTLDFTDPESFFGGGTNSTANASSNGTLSNGTVSFIGHESFFDHESANSTVAVLATFVSGNTRQYGTQNGLVFLVKDFLCVACREAFQWVFGSSGLTKVAETEL